MPQALLEPVVAGQTRFRAAGLAADARGVAVGREVLAVFATFDRVIAFLGACSHELSFADIFRSLTVERARQPAGAAEFLVRFALSDSYMLDQLVRIGAPMRARWFTGAASTYVRVRDGRAPFGYDLADVVAGEGADVVAVDLETVRRYRIEERIDPYALVLRLEPHRGPTDRRPPELLLVLVAAGLADRVMRYLWTTGTAFAGAALDLESMPDALLLRVRGPSARVFGLLRNLPGVECFVPAGPKMAVELGYRHPFDLEAVAAAFADDDAYLFRGRARRVERLSPPPRFVDGRHLVVREDELELREAADPTEQVDLAPVRIPLVLRRTDRVREPRGLVIERSAMPLLGALVRLLPPSVLAAAKLCVLADATILLATSLLARSFGEEILAGGALLPIGRRLCEVGPGVLVPEGWDLVPRVRPDLLRDLLVVSGDDHVLFRGPDEPPVRLSADRFVPLDAALIASLAPEEAVYDEAFEPPTESSSEVVYAPLGRFALWGVPSSSSGTRALGSGEGDR
ncbi:MAG: hypothetical protein D6705_13425 [Deltaproteobacteria bacterium]|nr:MAG: hypothetical protein D6705_13425 [Deltaproteobacteria bacterium]